MSRRYVVLIAGTAATTVQAAIFIATYVLAPEVRREFDLTVSQVGLLFAAPWLGSMVTALAWGVAADRWGERWTGSIGLVGAAVSLCFAAFATNFGVLVAGFVVAGAFACAVNSAAGGAIASWFDPRERGLAIGIRFLALPFAGVLVAVLFPPLLDAGGLRLPFLTLVCFSVVAAVAVMVAVSRGPHALPHASSGVDPVHPVFDRRVWRLAAATALIGAAQVAITGFVVIFLEGERGFTIAQAAAVLAGMNVFAAAGRLWSGWLSDRRGHRSPIVRVIAATSGVALLCVGLLAYSPPIVIAPLLVVAGGLAMSGNALLFTVAAEIGGARPGAAVGFQQTFAVVSAAVTPVLFGTLIEATTWRIGFAAAGAAALFGLYAVGRPGDHVSPQIEMP